MRTAMHTAMLSDNDLARFARQVILPGFGEEGQMKLRMSHVAVIGSGGLGAPVIQYLAAAGIGHLTIIDHDTVELTNLNRQVIHASDSIGQSKAVSAKEAALAINPAINITAHEARFDHKTAEKLLGDATIISDCSDTYATRLDTARACHRLKRVMVFGGAVGTGGQISAFNSGSDENSPCFSCVFPQSPDAQDLPGCSEAGILGPVTGIIGSLMALEVIRHCLKPLSPLGENLIGRLVLFDGMETGFSEIRVKKNPACGMCGR